jgi:hypothetical protein
MCARHCSPRAVTGKAGAPVSVAWAGPNAAGDFITITKPNAEEYAYLSYANARDGSPAGCSYRPNPVLTSFAMCCLARR